VRIEVGPGDLAASRYAISPLIEAMSALRLVAGYEATGALRPWAVRARPVYAALRRREPAVGALVSLFRHSGYNADFIQPPPASAGMSFVAELAAVRDTPADRARVEIDRNLAGHRAPPAYARRILGAPDVVDRLADGIAASWTALVEPEWPRLRSILERDIVQRAGRLAAFGWAAALADLHPRLSWAPDGAITVAHRDQSHHRLDGQGLLFVPSVFAKFIAYVDPPWPYAIVYRARGVAELLTPPAQPRPAGALERLLGPTRAAVLRALSTPGTTTQLAAQLGLGLGSVGDHLAVLRDAELVRRTRVGRAVRYEQTALGEALTAAPQPDTTVSARARWRSPGGS